MQRPLRADSNTFSATSHRRFALAAGPRRSRFGVWIGLLVVAIALVNRCPIALASPHGAGNDGAASTFRLRVVPERVVATPRYPARYVVLAIDSDGTARDVTSDTGLMVRSLSNDLASCESGTVQAKGVGTGAMDVSWGGQSIQVPIACEDDPPISYGREVMSALTRSGCNLGVCHGNLHGKGGFRLSLRGDDPESDHYRLASEYGQRRIDPWNPVESLLLKKATASVSHQGGQRFRPSDLQYAWIQQWIQDGAPQSASSELISLKIEPSEQHVAPECKSARVAVIATFRDGSIRDVTRWTRIELSSPTGVAIDESGILTASQSIDVSLSATYLTGRAASRVVFLGERGLPAAEPTRPSHPIDRWVQSQCDRLHLTVAPRADDWTLVRRLYLVTVGRLPKPEESLAFVRDDQPDRMERWVERLLADPDFDFAWALRWSDLLRNEEKVMSARGAALFHEWLRAQTASDRSLQAWMSELVSSTGSTYENPPAAFYRTHRDPMVAAESTAQVFLGLRLQCAKCHNHPFDAWKQDDYYGLAAYFTTVERKQIDNKPKDALDKHVITGDEVISLTDRPPQIQHPGRSQSVEPRPLPSRWEAADVPNEAGPSPAQASQESKGSVLQALARWMTEDNSQFDANMANRIWYQYFGRGIVDPPDDFRDSNPPSNPELLRELAQELRRSNYSLKALSRLILTSDTFARSAAEDAEDPMQLAGAPYFAVYPVRRLGAEVLMDAIADVTDVPSRLPVAAEEDSQPITKAMRMPGVPRKPGFLTAFGKPNRLLDCECERTNQVSLGQSLALVNGVEVRDKLMAKHNIIEQLLSRGDEPAAMVEQLFLIALCRRPSERELQVAVRGLQGDSDRRTAMEDLVWALLNSKEFAMLR